MPTKLKAKVMFYQLAQDSEAKDDFSTAEITIMEEGQPDKVFVVDEIEVTDDAGYMDKLSDAIAASVAFSTDLAEAEDKVYALKEPLH